VGTEGVTGRQPGWYVDPKAEAGWRYWDGLSWTPFTHGESAVPGRLGSSQHPPTKVLAHALASHIQSVGGARRFLLVAMLISLIDIGLYIAILVLIRMGASPEVVIGLALLSGLAAVLAIVLALVAMYRLRDPLGAGAIALVPCFLLMFVHPLGLVVLLFLNWKATAYLRANGVRTTFFGLGT
jgi:hypothetical protein